MSYFLEAAFNPLLRRLTYFTLVFGVTLGGAFLMADILRANGMTLIEIAILLLFLVTFGLIVGSFWNAVIGFSIRMFCRDPLAFAAPVLAQSDMSAAVHTRTAVIMPIYNEDPERVFAGIEASYRSLESTGEAERFRFFILSDATDATVAAVEERCWRALRRRLNAGQRLHYRRRLYNHRRKVGNIGDFCRRWGHEFDFMIVLDADSVMAGDTMLRLVRIMQSNPRAGIIQTVPLPVNQETLFARFIQFGSRLCSELLSTGQSFWQLGEGNYYGHNAIIRIQPFVEYCQLPQLSGKGPLSGEILSHDFVEAALMRRAGWSVWNLPEGYGSYEEIPSNVLDYATRDRRWCQGNLQHLRFLFARGLHPLSRMHFARGVMSYVSSPLWLLLMALGLVQIIEQAATGPSYFAPGYNLFPIWPVIKTTEAISLFVVTIVMLLTPKILGIVYALSCPPRRAAFGGGLRLLIGGVFEIVFSALLAPVMMVFHSLFVISTLCGRTVHWNPQSRGSRGLDVREAFNHHRLQLVLGVSISALILQVVPEHFWWLLPVLAGLLLSAPLAVASSRVEFGRPLMRWRLLATPEETQPTPELRSVRALIGFNSVENAASTQRPIRGIALVSDVIASGAAKPNS